MVTNEVRREVARKLREKQIERNTPGYFEVQDLNFQALNYLKDLEACVPDGDSLFTVLADLIEPEPELTCKPIVEEITYQWGGKQYEIKCDKCGEPFIRTFSDKEFVYDLARNLVSNGIRFCQRCGAKVAE